MLLGLRVTFVWALYIATLLKIDNGPFLPVKFCLCDYTLKKYKTQFTLKGSAGLDDEEPTGKTVVSLQKKNLEPIYLH